MFKKLYNWIETNDPYYTQRLILHKSIYGLVLIAGANLLFKPVAFYALFATGITIANIHTAATFTSARQKQAAIIIPYITIIIYGSICYFAYPYKILFILTVLSIFILFNIATNYYLKAYKTFVPLIFNCSLLINNSTPNQGSLQTAINFISTILLSLFLILLIDKTFPNYYHKVVQRALIIYLKILKTKINNLINANENHELYSQSLANIEIIRNHSNLIKHKLKLSYYRIFLYTRNIFALLAVPINLKSFDKLELLHNLENDLNNIILSLEHHHYIDTQRYKINLASLHLKQIYHNMYKISLSWNNLCNK